MLAALPPYDQRIAACKLLLELNQPDVVAEILLVMHAQNDEVVGAQHGHQKKIFPPSSSIPTIPSPVEFRRRPARPNHRMHRSTLIARWFGGTAS